MRFGAGLSTDSHPEAAAWAAAEEAGARLGNPEVSLAVVSVSRHHARAADVVSNAVRGATRIERLIGCVAEVVIEGEREVEEGPAVAVWLASFPEPAETFHLDFVPTSGGGVLAGYRFHDPGAFLLVADPFSFRADLLLTHLNEHVPGAVVMGGLASGAGRRGDTRLFLDDRVLDGGAVGARLPGTRIHELVSQGCRPIGDLYTVTKAEGNVIHELAGRPPLERLTELLARLSPADRALVARGLHIGCVIDEYQAEPGRGDFLVRGVIGVEPETGSMVVGDEIEVGRSVRFHVRDEASADEDLRGLLERQQRPVAGALLFTCNGRGTRLFSVPDHDASLVSRELGSPPLVGFNCAGEIGPIGGKNFLHGFTASVAVFADD